MKTLLMIILLAGTLPQLCAQESKPATQPVRSAADEAESLAQAGREAVFRREWNVAIEKLSRAQELAPEKTSYRLSLALAHRYSGDDGRAETILRAILETAPDHVEAGVQLAEILAAAEKHQEVIRITTPLLKYRRDYMIYHLRARAALALGDSKSARTDLLKAIEANPSNAQDHYLLGNIHLLRNHFASAADSYNQALNLGLRSQLLHYKLATVYFNLRNYFGQVVEIEVKSGRTGTLTPHHFLIEAVPGQKDMFRAAPAQSAIYHLARAMELGLERTVEVSLLEANIYLSAGRFAAAYERYKGVEEKVAAADKALFYYYFAQAAFGSGRPEEYLDFTKKAIHLDRKSYESGLVEAYLRVADARNESGDLAGYIQNLELAVRQSPLSAALHYRLGNAYEEAQRPADALTEWRMVLDLEPEHPRRTDIRNKMARLEIKKT